MRVPLFLTVIVALQPGPASAQRAAREQAPTVVTAPAKERLEYLNPAQFDPARLLPAPPGKGSRGERLELTHLHALRNVASRERLAQAKWDAAHEDPAIFNSSVGQDLAKLPNTWALLKIVQNETDLVIGMSKTYFARVRPYGIDPSLAFCQSGDKLAKSYPSGHSGLGYSVAYALAQLVPDRAPQILARATDYALSRELCGAHFPSDTEASHVVATLSAAELMADPRLAGRIAAARAELASR